MYRVVVEALIAFNKGSKFKRKPANWRERINPVKDFFAISIIDPRAVLKRMTAIEESPAPAAQMRLLLHEGNFIAFFLEKISCRRSGESSAENQHLHL